MRWGENRPSNATSNPSIMARRLSVDGIIYQTGLAKIYKVPDEGVKPL